MNTACNPVRYRAKAIVERELLKHARIVCPRQLLASGRILLLRPGGDGIRFNGGHIDLAETMTNEEIESRVTDLIRRIKVR